MTNSLFARGALALSCALALAPAVANAGLSSQYAYCSKNSDGSGFCEGTMQSFLKSADPSAYAQFSMGPLTTSTPTFQAYLNGAGYFCMATNAYPDIKQFWPQFVDARSLWWISWNSSGICTSGGVQNASSFP